MNRRTSIILLAILLALAALALRAEEPGDDPIARELFAPDLVMKHGREIGLDDKQRSAIREAVQKTQSKALDAQFDLQEESEKMARLLQASPVDEAAVLAQLDRVLALEREVKRAQIALLVRIKNQLTPAQQGKLRELRRRPS
jgi:Spy/CpxP family protein refolding chaperone